MITHILKENYRGAPAPGAPCFLRLWLGCSTLTLLQIATLNLQHAIESTRMRRREPTSNNVEHSSFFPPGHVCESRDSNCCLALMLTNKWNQLTILIYNGLASLSALLCSSILTIRGACSSAGHPIKSTLCPVDLVTVESQDSTMLH